MKTMLLDVVAWDLVLDVNNNIAIATDPYSQAQDAASAERTFLGKCYYNTTLGIPYFQSFLGRAPNVALMKSKYNAQALLVPGIVAAKTFFTSFAGRRASGQVQITNSLGQTAAAAF